MASPPQRKMARKVRPGAPAEEGFLSANFGTISSHARGLFETGWFFLCVITVVGTIAMYSSAPRLTPAFLVISLPTLYVFRKWTKTEEIGLPIFPIFVIQQAVVFTLPIFAYREGMEDQYESIFFLSAALSGIFCMFFYWGWKFTQPRVKAKPSKLNLSLGEGEESDSKCLNLAFALLGGSFLYHVFWRAGLLDSLGGLVSVIRTFSSAGAMLGALLGGIVIGKIPTPGRRVLFWSLIIALATISLIDVLLSDASRVVLAAVVGMSLGKGKPPWILLVITFAIVGFLNQGKVTIREQYWERGSNSTNLKLSQLPTFFTDWMTTSTRIIIGNQRRAEDHGKKEGSSVFERINNLQNTLFVVDAIRRHDKPLLKGDTYTLIPPLFIPRAFWPGKPRAHKGQAILNVHFGRQKNEEETHRVYIAWGILPEAIGNFGVWGGPIFLGLALGASLGWLERVSLRKKILSVEGLALGGLLLITAGSYEMVASVLLTSTFQFIVAVSAAGFGLFTFFRGQEIVEHEKPEHRKKRVSNPGPRVPRPTQRVAKPRPTIPVTTQPLGSQPVGTHSMMPPHPMASQPIASQPMAVQPAITQPMVPQAPPSQPVTNVAPVMESIMPQSLAPEETPPPIPVSTQPLPQNLNVQNDPDHS